MKKLKRNIEKANKLIENHKRLQEDFKKTILVGKMDIGAKKRSSVTLDIEVKKREKAIDWITLQPVENRDVVSISGSIMRYGGGQINDTLMAAYRKGDLDLAMNEDDFLTLMKIWDKYHLNDLIPGSIEQEKKKRELEKAGFDISASNYDELVKVLPTGPEGYKYGSRWLSREVPQYIVKFLEKL